jgi:hypothetical protein
MHHHPGVLAYTKASLANGGGGGGAQPDMQMKQFYLSICKCFNNQRVTVWNWCYNCWNNPTTTRSGPQRRKAQVNSDPDTVKKGVLSLQTEPLNTLPTKEYNTNPIVNHIGFIYI